MKTVKITSYYEAYEAYDGEVFNSAEECRKYEESAYGILAHRLSSAIMAKDINSDIFDTSDESQYDFIIPTTQEHIDAINQIYFLFGGHSTKKPIVKLEDCNQPILWGHTFCGGNIEWAWFYKINDVIKECTNNQYKVIPVSGSDFDIDKENN